MKCSSEDKALIVLEDPCLVWDTIPVDVPGQTVRKYRIDASLTPLAFAVFQLYTQGSRIAWGGGCCDQCQKHRHHAHHHEHHQTCCHAHDKDHRRLHYRKGHKCCHDTCGTETVILMKVQQFFDALEDQEQATIFACAAI